MPKVSKNLSKLFTERLKNETSLDFVRLLFKKFPELELYLVGGIVRDIILGITASKDFDFVARHAEVRDLVAELNKLGWCDLAGRDFGVIKFKPQNGNQFIDIALPRSEQGEMTGGYRDFTLQVDKDLEIEKDLARRDLTINALAWDIKNKKIIDPFEGQKDLESKTIRAVGKAEVRFQEDYSRILRAIRFACQFNFSLEPATKKALIKLAPNVTQKRQITRQEHLQRKISLEIIEEERQKHLNQLQALSAEEKTQPLEEELVPSETLTRELLKALAAAPAKAIELLDEFSLLNLLIPEAMDMKGCTQPEHFHAEGDVWTHTILLLEKISTPEFTDLFPDFKISGAFVLGCFLHDIGKPTVRTVDESQTPPKIKFYGHDEEGVNIAKRICTRLKLSKGIQEKIVFMLQYHMFVMSAPSVYKFRAHKFAERFIDSPHSPDLLALFYLDVASSIRPDGTADFKNFEETLERINEIKETRSRQPQKIITGDKVMELLDLPAGPAIACVLELVAELKDQGKINRAGDAEKFLRDRAVQIKKLCADVTTSTSNDNVEKILKTLIV